MEFVEVVPLSRCLPEGFDSLWGCIKNVFVQALLLSPRAPLFVAPSEARGPSALTRLGMTKREACLGMTSRDAVPSASEGCLAIARQDGVRNILEQPKGLMEFVDVVPLSRCLPEGFNSLLTFFILNR